MKTYGPYTPLVTAGATSYVSGQVGVDPATGNAPAGIASQTKQALDSLTALLIAHDLLLTDVVKTTVFLADMADFAVMNEIYLSYFESPRPARSTVAVVELPRIGDEKLLVEIEAVVVRSKS